LLRIDDREINDNSGVLVMAGLDPAIQAHRRRRIPCPSNRRQFLDGRVKPGHDRDRARCENNFRKRKNRAILFRLGGAEIWKSLAMARQRGVIPPPASSI